ncbi:MAG: endonuclease/exonuclease/phosphatase family protein [Alphaproteobacteria bacterium]|nr:MAG: endonuclease/exonuclease/phosphatase family protein [Alphaproteobacteria bacterium]
MHRKIIDITVWGLLLGLIVATLWPFVEQSTWIGDILLQTRIWTLYASAVVLGLALCTRRFMAGLLIAILSIVHLTIIAQSIHPAPRLEEAANAPHYRIMTMNIWKHRHNLDDAIRAVDSVNPDILWVQELNKERFDMLYAGIRKNYPYYAPRNPELSNKYERAFFSKYPFEEEWDLTLDPHYKRWHVIFHAYFSDAVNSMHFVGLHLLSPRTQERVTFRNEQVNYLNERLLTRKERARPLVMAGDMNSVTWQPMIESLMLYHQLAHTQASLFSTPLTWPTSIPQWMRVPIDQILVQRGWCSGDLQRAPATGSDHDAVYADIAPCDH